MSTNKKNLLLIILALMTVCSGCGNTNINGQEKEYTGNVDDNTNENNNPVKIEETEVDPFEGVSVSVSGYEPYVSLNFEYDPFDLPYMDASFELQDPDTIIKNGDSVTVNFIYDEDLKKSEGYKCATTSKNYEIETDGYYVRTPEQLSGTIYEEINERIQAAIETEFLKTPVKYRTMQMVVRNNDYPYYLDVEYETNIKCAYVYIGAADEKDESAEVKSKIYLIYDIQCKDSSIGESDVYLTYTLDNTIISYPDQEVQIEEPGFPELSLSLEEAKEIIDAEIKSTYHSMEFIEKKGL